VTAKRTGGYGGEGDESEDEARAAETLECFDQCDADHDGVIDYEEFVALLHNLHAEMSSRELKIGFREIDSDNDGAIDYEEFNAWWADHWSSATR
jgi:calmodulin